ncbi:2'-deoxynucleoside 5'-phosphate N-hydrolase 1 isoform X2 [Erpetoichthys calabaricus]|uniref:2'-deoxynucleoside 5'-phosphate N-hydrolase 1 isoform X2 n=1 Tax=Erpetoichthys calabaricus TaxID=27687 RepID=UPI002234136A|nr:2'-deoxynucleoside 5'-phosphate N-hydrolase 1 isoform X2 [Erpetoichthys calabaricus]
MSLNIYFCGSIRGGRQDVAVYQKLVKALQTYGKVLTEHVSDRVISEKVIVAEVTQPSLGVGYELGRAVAMNKRILCLFRPSSGRVLSAMIRGAETAGSMFKVQDYTEEEAEKIIEEYFSTLDQERTL